DPERAEQVLVEHAQRKVEVQLRNGTVGRTAAAHQDVIELCRQAAEEPLQFRGVIEIQRRRAEPGYLSAGAVEPLRVAAGDDELGAGRTRLAGGLQTDTGAAADDHDDLPRKAVRRVHRGG